MTASELKIGDWVLAGGEPVQIQDVCVENSTLTVYDDKTDKVKEYRYNELKPIPLTKEILEKNGWVYSQPYNDWTYSVGDVKEFCIYEGGRGFIIKQSNSITDLHTIAWVHELQHILWALGIDDNITIE